MRVLQLGPLAVNHVWRWRRLAAGLGARVHVAGHVSPGRRIPPLGAGVADVDVAPAELYGLGVDDHVAWLNHVVERLQPDVVQAHWLTRWGLCAALTGRPGVVVTPWGSDVYQATGEQRERADRAIAAAGVLVARSPHMRRTLLARGAAEERVASLDLGVNLVRFRPARAAERVALRRRLRLGDGPVVLSFRAPTALYRLDVVVRAFQRLRERLPDATLALAYGGAPVPAGVRGALDDLRAAGGDVRELGDVPHAEMAGLFAAADVGVSIPASDGSPSSVWEALACGLPLVVSDLPQVVERVGAGPAVAVEATPQAVAAALEAVLTRPGRRRAMARAGRAWAKFHADERRQAARLGEVYAAAAAP